MATTVTPALSRLKTTALVIIGSVLIQLGLGVALLTSYSNGLAKAHSGFGYITLLASIVAAFFAFQLSKADSSAKGLFFHALSLPVLAIIQTGLGEMIGGSNGLKWLHVALGIAFVGAAVSLYTLLDKRIRGHR
ncbi:hypothetical protein EDD41_2182 [Luteococcus japonicus]|uniref:Cytochrome b561 domain-containing protein n=1 Tax=Luteococcus japonicus TaxID=33984 RepID=A0A3N1ZWT9_9ACTN|nr:MULTISPECIES: hypothetical protein [Luteococcus]MDN5563559.1 hypothetical protein [Luteococcus sp.]ROR54947.1 hypothetical protein EDD41_2182 [Luteococcus japonicus]